MAARPTIAIVGPGRLGSALAAAVYAAGFEIREIVGRDAAAARRLARRVGAAGSTVESAALDATVTILAVNDGAIRSVAGQLSGREWRGRIALHCSGALTADELSSLRERGAAVAAAHPMMTFVAARAPQLAGVRWALEGDARALRAATVVIRALGGSSFSLKPEWKPLYHAWGAFGSPLLIALLATADEVASQLGVDEHDARTALAPMLRQTLENYVQHGAAAAFSGPLVRGDAATVRKHLRSLEAMPDARAVYLALARSALRRLPVGRRAEMEDVLGAGKRKSSS